MFRNTPKLNVCEVLAEPQYSPSLLETQTAAAFSRLHMACCQTVSSHVAVSRVAAIYSHVAVSLVAVSHVAVIRPGPCARAKRSKRTAAR